MTKFINVSFHSYAPAINMVGDIKCLRECCLRFLNAVMAVSDYQVLILRMYASHFLSS